MCLRDNLAVEGILVDITQLVALGYVRAKRLEDGLVRFTWQTATEIDNAGFSILAESPERLVTLKSELIPPRSSIWWRSSARIHLRAGFPTDYPFSTERAAAEFYMEEIEIRVVSE